MEAVAGVMGSQKLTETPPALAVEVRALALVWAVRGLILAEATCIAHRVCHLPTLHTLLEFTKLSVSAELLA